MPLQSTSGAASYDAFGGGAAAKVNYIEDFFQSYLRTGTGASATVTTGLDGSTKETLVWTKSRSAATNHKLTDNVRGVTKALSSNTTGAEATDSQGLTAFSSTGYTIGTNTDYNNSGATYVDWQWVAQPKFFDVVTYTGNGTAGRQIAHNLGSVPGVIIVKCTDTAGEPWYVYHRSLGATKYLTLNSTNAAVTSDEPWYNTEPTSTNFTVAQYNSANGSGKTYVAYLFAHNAGGFGLTGTDNVVSCGSYTGNGSATGPVVNLGYEPQFVMIKNTTASAPNWVMFDNMRGMTVTTDNVLFPNLTNNEGSGTDFIDPLATGFQIKATFTNVNSSGANYIYIAIRRGPMKVPTTGTSVFTPLTYTNPGTGTTITSLSFPADVVFTERRDASAHRPVWDRLRGATKAIYTNLTGAEGTVTDGLTNFASNVGYTVVSDNAVDGSQVNYVFRRAPSFFDEVCYTGTGVARTVSHNLGVAPELMIVKNRSIPSDWRAYSANLGATQNLKPNTTDAATSSTLIWNDTTPTSSVFTVGTAAGVNGSGNTYVAYLFATCAGVSKVGSYTGTGTTKQVDCGFTGGARFVLIKRTDSTGSWYVWDVARGISSGNDPYLLLNSTAAEVTNTDYIDAYSAGFEISSTAPAEINASGGSFIFLAIS